MLQAPCVSIITPAFNTAATLVRAYQSVQVQTFTDWEYLIVDDGSSDDTARLTADLARTDSRVRPVILTTNSGAGTALNVAIRQATGRYIAFLDADD